jgi:hypothetical protein
MKKIIVFLLSLLHLTILYGAEGGYSNYIPGTYGDFGMALEPPHGLTIRNDIYYYGASTNKTIRNTGVDVDGDITMKMDLLTMIYNTKTEFFNGNYAYGAAIPLVYLEVKGGTDFGRFSEDAKGLGDLTLIPGMLFWNEGNYHFSLGEFIIIPTADYDEEADANTGLNYYSFDTNFAATYLNPETGQDYSVNIGHIYNTENKDTDYQTGQEFHIDLVLNQFFSENFALGMHGFYLKQFTSDQVKNDNVNGLLSDFKGEAAGFGPAVMWATNIMNQDVTFIAKWLYEFHADNRIEGDHLFLSFALSL